MKDKNNFDKDIYDLIDNMENLEELDFNFETDALPIYGDGDWLRTKGTTLGADNGSAVAMSLAILADETLEHPALTVLVTTEEETGMDGVMTLDPANVPGDILINIDSEEEGVALASCAGGVRNSLKLPIEWTEVDAAGLTSYEIVILFYKLIIKDVAFLKKNLSDFFFQI